MFLTILKYDNGHKPEQWGKRGQSQNHISGLFIYAELKGNNTLNAYFVFSK